MGIGKHKGSGDVEAFVGCREIVGPAGGGNDASGLEDARENRIGGVEEGPEVSDLAAQGKHRVAREGGTRLH